MKKLLFIAMIFLSMTSFGQLGRATIYDTTRTDGQRFIVTAPYEVKIVFVDSLTRINDSVYVAEKPYMSLANSYMQVTIERQRIIEGDTIQRYETIQIPMAEFGPSMVQMIQSMPFKSVLYERTIPYINRKLSQE